MRCLKDYRLTQYLDNGCSPREAAAIESHLAECRTCGNRLEPLRKQKDFVARKAEILDPVVYPPEPSQLPGGIMSLESGWGMARRALRPVAAVLVLAALIAGGLFFGPQLFRGDGDGQQATPGNGTVADNHDIVRYVRVDGRPAQTYIIKERESNTTIIWVEPK